MMSSWTTCFLAALVLAVGGALWLGASVSPRAQPDIHIAAGRDDDAGRPLKRVGYVREMVPPK